MNRIDEIRERLAKQNDGGWYNCMADVAYLLAELEKRDAENKALRETDALRSSGEMSKRLDAAEARVKELEQWKSTHDACHARWDGLEARCAEMREALKGLCRTDGGQYPKAAAFKKAEKVFLAAMADAERRALAEDK